MDVPDDRSLQHTKPAYEKTAKDYKEPQKPVTAPGPLWAPAPGDEIGKDTKYRLIRRIGAGGMGEVYLALDLKLRRRIAVKFLLNARNNPELCHQFILEARTTARCIHKNIVTIFNADEYRGVPFIALQLLEGQPLSSIKGPISQEQIVDVLLQVANALECAHSHGITHRDVKPENIFINIDESGQGIHVWVCDFGIASVDKKRAAPPPKPVQLAPGRIPSQIDISEGMPSIDRGRIQGTPKYMPPEQWDPNAVIRSSSDMYSVGMMAWKLFANRHPFGEGKLSVEEIFSINLRDRPVESLREYAPSAPQAIVDLIDQCLNKDPSKRPTATEFIKVLEPFKTRPSRTTQAVEKSPYPGLSSYQADDVIFGRDTEIQQIVERVRNQPVAAIVGPSGVGKSSLGRAGFIPVMKSDGWEIITTRPGRAPLNSLANILTQIYGATNSNPTGTIADLLREEDKIVSALCKDPTLFGMAIRRYAASKDIYLAIFCDQLEDLFINNQDIQSIQTYLACLSGIAEDAAGPTRLLLAIRSDYLDQVTEHHQGLTAQISQGIYLLGALKNKALWDALVQPAYSADYRFESEDIPRGIFKDLQNARNAAVLGADAMRILWDNRDRAKKLITVAAYQSMGGVTVALGRRADEFLQGLSSVAQKLARKIIAGHLVTAERTCAIVPIEELRELSPDKKEVDQLLLQLERAKLIVIEKDENGISTAELAHSCLIDTWTTLKKWLDLSQEDAAFAEQLRTVSKQWENKKRDSGLLWRSDDLVDEAKRYKKRHPDELSKSQDDYINAVFEEQDQAQRRKKNRRIAFMGFLGLLALASVIALGIIANAKSQAERAAKAARIAEKRERAAKIEALEQAELAKKAEAAARESQKIAIENQKIAEEREKQKDVAEKLARQINLELEAKNKELYVALREKEFSRKAALGAKREAERAREEAIAAYRKERDRVRSLQKQFGGQHLIELDK